MHLLFVGDTHGLQDLDKVRHALPQMDLQKEDALIHLGDIGVAWMGEEDEALAFWRALPCKVLVCLGNHENYRWIAKQPIVKRFGCTGRDLGGNVFAPLAGQTARIGGKSLWFYPGGFSIDFFFRTPDFSIYKEELLPKQDAEAIMARFLKRKPVDFVLSHDGPTGFIGETFGYDIQPPPSGYWQLMKEEENSRAHPALLLNSLYKRHDLYTAWYFGHHHRDAASADGTIRCLWNEAVLYDTQTGRTEVVPLGE